MALRTNAPVEAPESDGRRLWLHHGSSISHGSNAASPTGTWPAHAALRAGVDPAETAAGKLTLEIIRDELVRLTGQRATDDPNLYYLDGRELYGEADSVKLPRPDELHPDATTHHLIGERFASHAFTTGGPFTASRET